MIKKGINIDLNIILSFLEGVTPSIFKNKVRIILLSKPKKLMNIGAQSKFRHSYKKCVYPTMFHPIQQTNDENIRFTYSVSL